MFLKSDYDLMIENNRRLINEITDTIVEYGFELSAERKAKFLDAHHIAELEAALAQCVNEREELKRDVAFYESRRSL